MSTLGPCSALHISSSDCFLRLAELYVPSVCFEAELCVPPSKILTLVSADMDSSGKAMILDVLILNIWSLQTRNTEFVAQRVCSARF